MRNVQDKCELKHGLIVPSDGKSDGLAKLWKKGIKVKVTDQNSKARLQNGKLLGTHSTQIESGLLDSRDQCTFLCMS